MASCRGLCGAGGRQVFQTQPGTVTGEGGQWVTLKRNILEVTFAFQDNFCGIPLENVRKPHHGSSVFLRMSSFCWESWWEDGEASGGTLEVVLTPLCFSLESHVGQEGLGIWRFARGDHSQPISSEDSLSNGTWFKNQDMKKALKNIETCKEFSWSYSPFLYERSSVSQTEVNGLLQGLGHF